MVFGSYISVRFFGEMIYWIVEQKKPAKDKTSRPYDFGLAKINNHGIYILYQTIATAWIVVGITIISYSAFILK